MPAGRRCAFQVGVNAVKGEKHTSCATQFDCVAQVEDYSKRLGQDLETTTKWLSPMLNYEP